MGLAHRLGALGSLVAVGALVASIAIACGGKIDGSASSGGVAPTATPTATGIPTVGPAPTGTATPGSELATRLAQQIAKSYCSTFDKCCRSTGLAPIDFARCVSVTETKVGEYALRYLRAQAVSDKQLDQCVDAVTSRLSLCASSDAKWWTFDGTPETSLFVPASVAKSCGVFLDIPKRAASAACKDTSSCGDGETCAIDECAAAGAKGEACSGSAKSCLDGDSCTNDVCEADPRGGATCKTDDECKLGFLCVGKCVAVKDTALEYKERHSPYRVSLESCQVFNHL